MISIGISFTVRDTAKKITNALLLLFLLLPTTFLTTGCEARGDKAYDILQNFNKYESYFPEKKWRKIASPELAGWSIDKLEIARLYSNSIHSGAVVVIENGVIIAEWGNITARYPLHSIRKSLMSAMYGICVDERIINLSSTLKELECNRHWRIDSDGK